MVIETQLLERVLGVGMSSGADFSEVFVEDVQRTGVNLDDGRIENLSSSRDRGAGVRVVSGDTTGFAHTADLSESGLMAAVKAAAAAANQGGGGQRTVALDATTTTPGGVKVRPEDVEKRAKVEVLRLADAAARAVDDVITQVSARYGDNRRRILVANSDGLLADR